MPTARRTHATAAWIAALALIPLCACRIESAAPSEGAHIAASDTPSGEVWIYTSMYRGVLDALEPLIHKQLPGVKVHWYQAGSEKVSSRIEAEHSAGAIRADIVATSDPFLYARLAKDGLFDRYVSPNALRTPRELMDPDGHWVASRVSTMVLVHRKEVQNPPVTFAALIEEAWRGEVAIGDPLTSGTAFTWTVFMEQQHGAKFFDQLRKNGVVVAGGNAAVLQKVESGEANVGVILLENALTAVAKGSPIAIVYPKDGAVLIPGPVAIFKSSGNKQAARAVVDVILSPEGQKIIVETGDMHAADPRLPGPRGERGLNALVSDAAPWNDAVLQAGSTRGEAIKQAFMKAFNP